MQMLRNAMRPGIALALVALATLSVVYGQQVTQENKGVKSSPQTALRAKNILGSQVHLQGNATAGTIEDIVFDDEGVIDYLIVSQNGKMVTVPWEAAKFNFEKRTAVINITQEQYQKIPTYTTQTYPQYYTPQYQTEIYGYYNLKPGQARRFERRINRR